MSSLNEKKSIFFFHFFIRTTFITFQTQNLQNHRQISPHSFSKITIIFLTQAHYSTPSPKLIQLISIIFHEKGGSKIVPYFKQIKNYLGTVSVCSSLSTKFVSSILFEKRKLILLSKNT